MGKTPQEIVEELDKYVIGQEEAKRVLAVAMRNRWRAQQLAPEVRSELMPKNILMIGPTGVGKTEILRRLSKIQDFPFIKVEATKFTEVGYVGRDVESIIRDLLDTALGQMRAKERERVVEEGRRRAEERLLDVLLPAQSSESTTSATREKMRALLKEGALDDREVEIEVEEQQKTAADVVLIPGIENIGKQMQDMLGKLFPTTKKRKKLTVPLAYDVLCAEETENLIDEDALIESAKSWVEESGIVFIDEIDKVASQQSEGARANVSREGVQRDLLPIVEGSTVNTRYGMVNTRNILFIAAGAFHVAKPSDLIPELQGRFPVRVDLTALTKKDFLRILVEPDNALIKQYRALLATEGVHLSFSEDAIEEIASFAEMVNQRTENIGARRLYTIVERILSEISFNAPNMRGENITIDAAYVQERLKDVKKDEDLYKYVL